ncbi:MAG TPA: RagB/SusD family nutrient uptake outer membrane protein, partial [Bacteroidales bacterium]|nr:RagB/SusD family nutrient uptake outer membrane protein [Bacteroidales bacterium]
INNVRNRAGLSSILSASQEQLLPLLLQEYRHEFAFEGHRWHDLTRTNMAVSTLGIEEFRTLWPIPISETQSNSAIKQNEGY